MSTKLRQFAIRVAALAAKETLHVVRDHQVIYLALAMPVVLVLLFGFAVSFDVDEIPLAVVDRDHSALTRRLVSQLDASRAFQVVARPRSESAITALLRRGAVRGALIVPRGFTAQLDRGATADLQLIVDGSDATTARTALGYSAAFAARYAARLAADQPRAQASALPLTARLRAQFNPAMRSTFFIVPGIAAVVLGILAVLLSTITIAREWERGSMEQLFATPVDRLSVVLGKLAPYVAIGLLQLLLILVLGAWLFEVPLRGSVGLLFLFVLLFLVSALGQGLLISMVTRNQQVATMVGAVSSILPGLLLSGFIFPIDNMPLPLQWIARIVPARYLIGALRGIMLSGRGLTELWPQLCSIAALAALLVFAATLRFRRRLD